MRLILSLAIALISTLPTHAQDWPSKPITIMMGYPAGSGLDVVARTLQEPLEKTLEAAKVAAVLVDAVVTGGCAA